jgi:hypothetical protein
LSNTKPSITGYGVVFLFRKFPRTLLQRASRWLDDDGEELSLQTSPKTKEELSRIVNAAKQEWLDAQSYFNNATEPDLVDHAILSLQAAERKYMYWLKRMKNSQ